MSGYVINIEEKALENDHFREVLFTAPHLQLVVMSLQPGEDIGAETHDDGDQFIRVEAGTGKAILDGKEHDLVDGSVVVIPAGTHGSVLNSVCEPVVESVAQREPLGELYRQLCLGGMPFPRRAFPLGLDLA